MIQVPENAVPGERALPGVWTAASSLCPLMVFPLCV